VLLDEAEARHAPEVESSDQTAAFCSAASARSAGRAPRSVPPPRRPDHPPVDRLPSGQGWVEGRQGESVRAADRSAMDAPARISTRTGARVHEIESRRAVRCRPPPRGGRKEAHPAEVSTKITRRRRRDGSDVDLLSRTFPSSLELLDPLPGMSSEREVTVSGLDLSQEPACLLDQGLRDVKVVRIRMRLSRMPGGCQETGLAGIGSGRESAEGRAGPAPLTLATFPRSAQLRLHVRFLRICSAPLTLAHFSRDGPALRTLGVFPDLLSSLTLVRFLQIQLSSAYAGPFSTDTASSLMLAHFPRYSSAPLRSSLREKRPSAPSAQLPPFLAFGGPPMGKSGRSGNKWTKVGELLGSPQIGPWRLCSAEALPAKIDDKGGQKCRRTSVASRGGYDRDLSSPPSSATRRSSTRVGLGRDEGR